MAGFLSTFNYGYNPAASRDLICEAACLFAFKTQQRLAKPFTARIRQHSRYTVGEPYQPISFQVE
jgi:hypothetical protein